MKKLLALMLAASLALSLAACGDSKGESAATPTPTPSPSASNSAENTPPNTPEPANETVAPSEKPQATMLNLLEKTTLGEDNDLEFTPCELHFTQKRRLDSQTTVTPPNGYICATLTFIAKNVGKEPFYMDSMGISIRYGDGYSFDGEPGVVFNELAPLTEESTQTAYFFVPEEVYRNKEEPLSIALGWGGKPYVIPIRPLDTEQNEAFHSVIDTFTAAVLDPAEEQSSDNYIDYLRTYAASAYLVQTLDTFGSYEDFPVATGEEIQEFLSAGPVSVQNNFTLRTGGADRFDMVYFGEDGLYGCEGEEGTPWRMEGDTFVFQWQGEDWACEARKLADNVYVMVCDGCAVRLFWRVG